MLGLVENPNLEEENTSPRKQHLAKNNISSFRDSEVQFFGIYKLWYWFLRVFYAYLSKKVNVAFDRIEQVHAIHNIFF